MKKSTYILGILLILILIFISYSLGFNQGENNFEENGLIINKGNETYHKYFDNYYGIDYRNEGDKIIFEIKNPCISIEKVVGNSMFPYWDNETLIMIDTCFPNEDLEVGDIIFYYIDWDMKTKLHHRITEINYEKRLIKTKGDNLETKDSFIGFDKIYGKDIGTLNILEDKKVVQKKIEEPQNNQICVCSSNSILKVCYTDKEILMGDNFVLTNNLKEENCKIGDLR